jgi:flagellar biosynthesis anti-sigma factor FlgM
MKINSDKPEVLTGATTPLERPAGAASAPGKTTAGSSSSSDQLTLSPEARLLHAAANGPAPLVRQDVVDRMRALLNQGAIGAEAEKLAESIIDNLLETSERSE